jgi:type IV secretory pathway TrbL component
MAGLARYAVEMGIALIVVALIIPMGLVMIAEANLTGVNSSVATIITIVFPILAVLGLALKFMPDELKSRVGI